jgi:hypothetical protein
MLEDHVRNESKGWMRPNLRYHGSRRQAAQFWIGLLFGFVVEAAIFFKKLKIIVFYYFIQRSRRQPHLTCFWNKIMTLLTFCFYFCVLTLLCFHVASFLYCSQFFLPSSSSLQYRTKVPICWPGMIRVKFGSNPSISFSYIYIYIVFRLGPVQCPGSGFWPGHQVNS